MKRIIGLLALIFTLCQPLPVTAAADDALPDGFIAIAPDKMNWNDAKAYCASKGGRLPLIDGKNRLSSVPSGTPVDGFGSVGAKWPSGLPSDNYADYWTGTEAGVNRGDTWVIGGKIGVGTRDNQSSTTRVVCVP